MTAVALTVGAISIAVLYNLSVETERKRLLHGIEQQAQLVEAAARHMQHASSQSDPLEGVLRIVNDAHQHLPASQPTPGGTFAVVKSVNGTIEPLFFYPRAQADTASRSAIEGGPWHQAVAGKTGSQIALDHRGVLMLAVYTRAEVVDVGLIAQIPLSQLRAPFVRAGVLVVVAALVLIAIGTMLFLALGDPVLRRLHDSEHRLRALFGNMRSGAVVLHPHEPSGDFVFGDVNRAGEQIGGFRRDQVQGRRLTEMFPAVEKSGLLQMIRRVARSGYAEPFPAIYYDDGRISGWREGYIYRLPTEDVVVLYDDVTDRILAERALRESEERYRRLFDRSPVPILVIDAATTRALEFNQALLTLLGFSAEAFAGMPMAGYEARLSPEQLHAQLATIVSAGNAEFETDWRCQDSSLRTVSVNVRVLEDGGRTVLHAVAIDITARIGAEKRARELFDQLLRMKRISELGQLASALAHELKQPLTAALNYINASRRTLETATPKPARACAFALKASAEIERTSALIHRLRQLVQQGTPQRTREDVNAIASETLQLATTGPARRNLTLVTRYGFVPKLLIDRIQVQQVLLNLIQNALEAMQTMPVRRLSIETAAMEDGSVQVAVGDTGPGMRADIAARLFQPYVTSKPGGIGIGLSLSRAIIRSHGGRIWWEPDPEGGCIFRFTLPPCNEPEENVAAGRGKRR